MLARRFGSSVAQEALSKMTDERDPFNRLDLQEGSSCVWTPPGHRGQTMEIVLPLDPSHLEKLKSLNLIEMQDKEPTLTRAGHDALS